MRVKGARALIAVLVAISVIAVLAVLTRAGSDTVASSGGVAIECSGATGVTDGCAAWGHEIQVHGPPSTTFEIEDVVRIRLDRPMLGFASTCTAEYFVSRYPDDAIWDEEVECRR